MHYQALWLQKFSSMKASIPPWWKMITQTAFQGTNLIVGIDGKLVKHSKTILLQAAALVRRPAR